MNKLKRFHERVDQVNRTVVVVDTDSDVGERTNLVSPSPEFSQADIDQILAELSSVFSDEPGTTETVRMSIDTGCSRLVVSTPYFIPVGLRENVQNELDKLLSQGIIRRSDSPWSSPLVPVKKPDGIIQLC